MLISQNNSEKADKFCLRETYAGACAAEHDPIQIIESVRQVLAQNGETPDAVRRLQSNLQSTGNVYGCTEHSNAVAASASRHSQKTELLFLLGKDAVCNSPRSAVQAIALMEAANVAFTVLEDEPDSGFATAFLTGASDRTREQMAMAAGIYNRYETIVAYDPQDAAMLLKEYSRMGIGLEARVESFPEFTVGLIRSGRLCPKKGQKKYTLQDSHWLAGSPKQTEAAREVLAACGDASEMQRNRDHTVPAGNLIMNEYMPEVMTQIARDRWNDAAQVNTQVLVTVSTAEYLMLKATQPEGMELMTLEEVVLKCL